MKSALITGGSRGLGKVLTVRLAPIRQFETLSVQAMEEGLRINILTPMLIIQTFIREFRNIEAKKTIVNISSGAARKGYSGWSQYCLAKAGMDNLINSLREEEKDREFPFGLFSFDPSVMDTNMQKEIREAAVEAFPDRERFVNLKKDGDLSDPDVVADVLLKLLETGDISEQSRYCFRDVLSELKT